MQKGFAPILVLVGILVIVAVAGGAYYFGKSQAPESQTQNQIVVSKTPQPTISAQSVPLKTLPPLLGKEVFPSQQVSYPASWPTDLQFPEQLMLMEAISGFFPESNYKGWSAKFRYQGSPAQTANFISSFLISKGWQIDREDFEEGIMLLIEKIEKNAKTGGGSFILESEPGNPSVTRILMTVGL